MVVVVVVLTPAKKVAGGFWLAGLRRLGLPALRQSLASPWYDGDDVVVRSVSDWIPMGKQIKLEVGQ